MKKSELAELISSKYGISKKVALMILELIIEIILKHLKEKKRIYIAGLGTFKLRERDRTFTNPKTKEKVLKKKHKKVVFRISKSVLNQL